MSQLRSSIRIKRQSWLFKASAVACMLSLMVFSYLLIISSSRGDNALANSYTAQQVIVAVNEQRKAFNLKPLIVNSMLMNGAQAKANDMTKGSYFSHVSPIDGKKWSAFVRESGYEYIEAGENLANGFDSVDAMVQAWMDSPTHRENILNPGFEETGLGISFGKLEGYPTIFVAQNFGTQAKKVTPPQAITPVQSNSTNQTPSNPSAPNTPAENVVPATESSEVPQAPAPKNNFGEILLFPDIEIR